MKKIISSIFCLISICSLAFGVTFYISSNSEINQNVTYGVSIETPKNNSLWPSSSAVKPTGDGTSGEPYKIASAENLVWVREQTKTDGWSSGKYFEQTKNIDLGNYYWDSIGTKDSSFQGLFNGNGYSILGLYINHQVTSAPVVENISYCGLFGYVTSATLRGIVIRTGKINVNVIDGATSQFGGAICGYAINSMITGCANFVDIEVQSVFAAVGGIVGTMSCENGYSGPSPIIPMITMLVTYCYNFGDINFNYEEFNMVIIGGVVGSSSSEPSYLTSFNHNYNAGNFTGGRLFHLGGVFGSVSNLQIVSNNFNVGNNSSSAVSTGAIVANVINKNADYSAYSYNYSDRGLGFDKIDSNECLGETNHFISGIVDAFRNWDCFTGSSFVVNGTSYSWKSDSKWNSYFSQKSEINEGYPYLTTEKFASITCYANGGAVNGMETETSSGHIYGSTQKIYTMPTRPGYTFKGWVSSHGDGSLDSFGKFHYVMTDGFYDNSYNITDVYNNSNNGNVRLNIVDKPDDLKLPRSKKVLEISTVGEASPGYGGFHNCFDSKPNGVYY